ncbi:class I SAM-dependent methyltransferase [Agrobacterium tumefaciens]|uniref:methyltransferase domain-containing protein n=1 Tax=Agrobacterium tumefaciens TaxID=358 RepID=UPI0015734B43|nr:class I SAM-dependent methyltransferase [Agrobacterium tumefaciens]
MTDIDISEEILVKAKAKIAEGALLHVKESHVMDACDMAFPDASFDVVSLPFVIPLIPDADRLLSECARSEIARRNHHRQQDNHQRRRHAPCRAAGLAAGAKYRTELGFSSR